MTTAVLIPCYNESVTIAQVVKAFRRVLPAATIYVYDNNSTDNTAKCARDAGAIVRCEPQQGKGNVVRRMFADVEADIYVLVDGDATYDAAMAPVMVKHLIENALDMVNGARTSTDHNAWRHGHRFGNYLFSSIVAWVFGRVFRDMLSGYRVFSRRYVKSFPALARGFETEAELTVHALELRMPVAEIDTVYHERPMGSVSKLRTVRDGFRILFLLLRLMREERPLMFFTIGALALAGLSLGIGTPVVLEFMDTHLVSRLPSALLAMGTMILAFNALVCGLILDTVTQGRREMKRMRYLNVPSARALFETTRLMTGGSESIE